MMTEGTRPLLSDWFTTLHFLLNEVDAWKQESLEDDVLSFCLTTAWLKIEKYYKLVDQTPIYYAAILLNPTLKTHYLRSIWHQPDTIHWIESTKEKVKALWRSQYKGRPQLTAYKPVRTDAIKTAFDRLSSAKRLRVEAAITPVDQLDSFLSSDAIPWDKDDHNGHEFDVVAYWMERRWTTPELAQMALDVFSIPLMSDDNERSFSSGRDMITYRRTALLSDVIEACQCLKSWLTLPEPRRYEDGTVEAVFDNDEVVQTDLKAGEITTNTAGGDTSSEGDSEVS
jgi:hypothetical protein